MNIFLFHRDLRLIDNTTLIYQMKNIKNGIIPIFIFTIDQIDKNDYFSNNSVQFMVESLHELNREIELYNGKIYYFKGNTMDVINEIHKKNKINSIGYNIDYTPYARKRDNEIREYCKNNNIICYEKEDYLLYDILNGQTKKQDSSPYLVFTPFKNYCLKNLIVRDIDNFKKFKFVLNKSLEKIKYYINDNVIDTFYKKNTDININGGRHNGLQILKTIEKFKDYNKKRDILTYKTTFLGAHLHFTTVSIREVYQKILNKLGKNNNLINELHWRDFYANITYEFPKVLDGQVKIKNKSYKNEYDNIKWSYNKKIFEKWCNGETGFPLIDASMKQLNKTGFMHNRCRMIVASFLTKDLHIDWRLGEKYFASKLVDYDPINNNGGWQWCSGSGTDAQPYFRIFNPWTQIKKYDPNCEYIKKWLPQLNNIDIRYIYKWYDVCDEFMNKGVKYHRPIVDHDKERIKTIKMYKLSIK